MILNRQPFHRRVLMGLGLSVTLLLSACTPLVLPLPQGAVDVANVQYIEKTGSFKQTITTAAPNKTVYLVFTNTSTSSGIPLSSVNAGNITVNGRSFPAPAGLALPKSFDPTNSPEGLRAARSKAALQAAQFRQVEASLTISPAGGDTVGASANFSVLHTTLSATGASDAPFRIPAHCRLQRTMTFTDGRVRSLSIWVEDDRWNSTGGDRITQTMVDAMGNHFLSASENPSDIYHMDTAVLGEPWGDMRAHPEMIQWDAGNTITVLLANLNSSYTSPYGFVVGYFHDLHNNVDSGSIDYPSNQRPMFFIDATLYASDPRVARETTWAETNYWSEEIYSTLAHEFQHMIQFYQKGLIKRGDKLVGDAWLSEMCSMLMEDLAAEKMGVSGPRGVPANDGTAGAMNNTGGRIPIFNYFTDYPWYEPGAFSLVTYSSAYMLGAWLIRDFGGAEMLRKVVQSPEVDQGAILSAIAGQPSAPATFGRLLAQWSAAVLLSDRTDNPAGLRYNVGGWFPYTTTSTTPGISFRLGSINDFNFDQVDPGTGNVVGSGPYCYAGLAEVPFSTFYRGASLYIAETTNSKGKLTIDVTLPEDVVLTVVTK